MIVLMMRNPRLLDCHWGVQSEWNHCMYDGFVAWVPERLNTSKFLYLTSRSLQYQLNAITLITIMHSFCAHHLCRSSSFLASKFVLCFSGSSSRQGSVDNKWWQRCNRACRSVTCNTASKIPRWSVIITTQPALRGPQTLTSGNGLKQPWIHPKLIQTSLFIYQQIPFYFQHSKAFF